MELGENEFAIHKRNDSPLSMLMLDIDHFKAINDTYGHACGDCTLTHFAQLCKYNIKPTDIHGRIGGEEFAVILPNTGLNEAIHLRNKFEKKLNQQRNPISNP